VFGGAEAREPSKRGPKVTLHNARGMILKRRDFIMHIYTMQVVEMLTKVIIR